MSHRDNHAESPLDPRVIDYFYGEMSKPDLESFQAELESNPELARQLQQLQVLRHLTEEMPSPEPAADLVQSILKAAHQREHNARGWARDPGRGPSRWFELFQLTVPRLATAMALVLVAVVGLYVVRSARKASHQAPAELALEKQLPTRAHSEPPAPEHWEQEAGQVLLRLTDAPSAPAGVPLATTPGVLPAADVESGTPKAEPTELRVEASLAEAPHQPLAPQDPGTREQAMAVAQTGSPAAPQAGALAEQESPPAPEAAEDSPEKSEVAGEMDAAKNRRRSVVGLESGGGLGVGGGGAVARPDRGVRAREGRKERQGRSVKDVAGGRMKAEDSVSPGSVAAADGSRDTDDTVIAASGGLWDQPAPPKADRTEAEQMVPPDGSVVQADGPAARENAVEEVAPRWVSQPTPVPTEAPETAAGAVSKSTEVAAGLPAQAPKPVAVERAAVADKGRDENRKKKRSSPESRPSKTLAAEFSSEVCTVTTVPEASDPAADCTEIWKGIGSARSPEQAREALNLLTVFERGSCASGQSSASIAMAKARLLLILGRTSEARSVLLEYVDDPALGEGIRKLLEKIPE